MAFAALLAGCASSSGLRPREKTLTPPAGTNAIVWPQDDWWRQFGDPQLDALVKRATADNPNLHLAQARVERAQALAGLAQSGLKPSIDANANFQRQRFTEQQFIPPPYAGSVSWNNSATLDLSWDLDLWGRQRETYAAALTRAQASALDAREATLALQTAVVRSYVQWSETCALLDVARSNLRREQDILKIARLRLAAGIGTQLEVSEATTALPDSRARIEALNARSLVLRHQLAALSGQPPTAGDELTPPRLKLNTVVPLPAEIPADLLGHRPDLVAERLRVQAAGHAIAAAKAAFYPDVNLAAFAGFQALSLSKLLTGSAAQYGAGPAISLPIFEGGRLRSGLRGADADYDMAVDAYNAALLHALQQTADDIGQLHSLAHQSDQVNAALAAARHADDQARRGYRAGLTNQLNVLDTQRTLLEQQQHRVQIDAQRMDRYALLMQALGGGFTEPAPPATQTAYTR